MTPGLYYGIPEPDYHAGPGVSKSDLDLIARSPFHYAHRHECAETPAMRLGTAIHTAILEPGVFDKSYAKANGRRNKKAKLSEMTPAEWETLHRIRDAVWNHPTCQDLFNEGTEEMSAWWLDPDTELLCKCRPDWSRPGMLVDLKTTTDARPAGFARAVEKYRYHVQAAYYTDGWAAAHGNAAYEYEFVFVAVEKEPPYAIGLYKLSNHALAKGRELYRRDLLVYDDCCLIGRWPGYSNEIETIRLYEERRNEY